MDALLTMTREQLATVEDFTVENQFGKVQFKQAVNLLGIDLTTIQIEPTSVTVYSDDSNKPDIGE